MWSDNPEIDHLHEKMGEIEKKVDSIIKCLKTCSAKKHRSPCPFRYIVGKDNHADRT